MANERIRLDFVEFTPKKAITMLGVAQHFATSKPDGRPGLRHGTVAVWPDGLAVHAYWTPARTVIVREISADARLRGGE